VVGVRIGDLELRRERRCKMGWKWGTGVGEGGKGIKKGTV